MADIDTKGLPRLLQDQATAAQASAGRALNFSKGRILRALAEMFAGVGLWLQAQILKVLTKTRLATSTGADVDSFLADYGTARVAASPARGQVTFSRVAVGVAAFIPVGALVRTADATQTYAVVADPANGNYGAAPPGYTIPAMTASINVPVQAVTAGVGGNVDAGTVTLVASSLAGVDTVTNAGAFTGGVDAETDAVAKARFPRYIASLSKGTTAAVEYAVSQVQAGLKFKVIPNQDAAGNPKDAYFLVIIDDGTGAADMSLVNRVGAAINTVVALGVTFGVLAVDPLDADVSMTITTDGSVVHADAVAAVAAALEAYINTLGIGVALRFSRLPAVAYGAYPGITNVSAVTVNGGTADLVPTARQRVVPDLITVA